MNVIEFKLTEMNEYLIEKGITGNIICNDQLILILHENTTLKQVDEFKQHFGLPGDYEIDKHNEFYYYYFEGFGNFLKDIFQTEITQQDCKGEGIKLYRKQNKNTFKLNNGYLAVFENKSQLNETMDEYLQMLANGRHENVVFAVMKHERIPVIKKIFK